MQCLNGHQRSVNIIATLPANGIFVSGAADATIIVWDSSNSSEAKLLQSIALQPRILPLACTLTRLRGGATMLAVAGTSNAIHLYGWPSESSGFGLQATLTGHEGWIRSLDFVLETPDDHDSDVLLASASQDKYIRLWRLHQSHDARSAATSDSNLDSTAKATKKSLSNKMHQVGSAKDKYTVTFEALLVGHEDWIYTVRWGPTTAGQMTPTLLSASADNSVAMWRADEISGVWICHTRLGEISSLKGSTTATGSTGGSWIGLWQPDGTGIASLGRTGSWRRWTYDSKHDMWMQQVGISGHTQEVRSVAWSPDGSYLLSTGSDQTTRLFAEWKRDAMSSWHEFARPQIHGYDLNCIDTLTTNRFVSGADEKLLRVFDKPKAIDDLLSSLCGIKHAINGELPDAANIPVLGLSNKAVTVAPEDEEAVNGSLSNGFHEGQETSDARPAIHKPTLQLAQPPFEEHLARHTLWPEHEKLYGHGYEISAVAASDDGSLIATACKASSIDHAVVRLYECKDWREIKPPLTAHSLTVTSLQFSTDNQYLLSVSRDRGWFVYERDLIDGHKYSTSYSNPKGHTRMILDCCWAPTEGSHVFATAGRDKTVKIWKLGGREVNCIKTITAEAAVTAIAFDHQRRFNRLSLACGTETGGLRILQLEGEEMVTIADIDAGKHIAPSGTINVLRWRPMVYAGQGCQSLEEDARQQLVSGSDDNSIRVFTFAP